MSRLSIGAMTEQLVLQTPDAPRLPIVTLTCEGTIVTVTTDRPHNRVTGDFVDVADAVPVGYRGRFKVTVTGPMSLRYTLAAGLSSPATTPGTLRFATTATGGQDDVYRAVDTLAAEHVSTTVNERLQAETIQNGELVRFRIYARPDIRTNMRVLWTPSWPMGSPRQALGVVGVRPHPDNSMWMLLDVVRRAQ